MKQWIRKHSNVFSLVLMIILTCITQVFILLKTSLVAGLFGTTIEMDAYNLANSITSFLFGILAAGIPTIVIPCYVKQESRQVIDSFLTLIYGSILVISILISVFRVQIIGAFANRSELFVNVTCEVLVVLLFAQFMYSITGVTDAYFQCEKKYNYPKVINLAVQAFTVLCLAIFRDLSIYQYAFIISIGLVISCLVNSITAYRTGWKYRFCFKMKDKRVRELLIVFVPIMFSNGVDKFTLFVDSLIASRLNEGMLTVLSYSNQIASMIDTILIGNLLIYVYPKMVKRIQCNMGQQLFWEQTVLLHNIVLLVVTGFFAVGREGIYLLFRHGSFSQESADLVFSGAWIYIFGQQTAVIISMIYRYYFSVGDTKSTAKNSMIVSFLNVIISVVLVQYFGVFGIIWGTVLSSAISLVLIIIKFRKKFGLDRSFWIAITGYIKNVTIAVVILLIVVITKKYISINHEFVAIIVFGAETVVLYLAFTFLFNKRIAKYIKDV